MPRKMQADFTALALQLALPTGRNLRWRLQAAASQTSRRI